MQVNFTVLGEPKGKGRPKFVRATGRTYTPKDTADYETLVKWSYAEQCKGQKFGDDEMLQMNIKAYYSIPKSVSKSKREQMLNETLRPTKKPDTDNIIKIIADACNNIAYRDDAQIVDCVCSKFYSENPRVEVKIMALKEQSK